MKIVEREDNLTARDYAYKVLTSNIISLKLAPGSKVIEADIAKKLNVSRTPVREALMELRKLKIVDIYPQSGTFISLIDSNLVDESRTVRTLLEKFVVRSLCERTHDIDFTFLDNNISKQKYCTENKMYKMQRQLDNEFHKLLFEINSMKFTYNMISGMLIHFDRIRTLNINIIPLEQNYKEHAKLLTTIKNKDAELGEKLIEEHITAYKIDEKKIKEKYPEYFYEE